MLNPTSDDQLNDQINDKLSQLWTGMRNKKKQLLRNLTPSYSRRSQRTLSQLNATNTNLTNNYSSTENQLLKVKEKLAGEESILKIKETEIQRLKGTIEKLNNDKKLLVKEIQNVTNQSIMSVNHNQMNNEQTINDGDLNGDYHADYHVDGRTANFCPKDQHQQRKTHQPYSNKRDKPHPTSCSNNKENLPHSHNQTTTTTSHNNYTKPSYKEYTTTSSLQDLSKARLIDLLRSTQQYRQFAYYYDSHQLSYLKRLQQQHKKNCQTNHSQVEKKYWAPKELCDRMKQANVENRWGLKEGQVEEVVGEMKTYFQKNEDRRVREVKETYERKVGKLERQRDHNVPYDLVRLSNAKVRRQASKNKKNKSLKN